MGNEMLKRKLRWRTSYSVNFQTLRSGGVDANLTARPLPGNEIITDVKAFPRGDTVADPAYETYVELGLFYTHPDSTSGHGMDTNYVYVVNRRCFERPLDVDPESDSGEIMDGLAETRRIRLKFNLLREEFDQYEFIRVREIAADLDTLPLGTTRASSAGYDNRRRSGGRRSIFDQGELRCLRSPTRPPMRASSRGDWNSTISTR